MQRYPPLRNTVLLTAYTPGVFLVERAGVICYTNDSPSYISEPDNREPLAVLERIEGAYRPAGQERMWRRVSLSGGSRFQPSGPLARRRETVALQAG